MPNTTQPPYPIDPPPSWLVPTTPLVWPRTAFQSSASGGRAKAPRVRAAARTTKLTEPRSFRPALPILALAGAMLACDSQHGAQNGNAGRQDSASSGPDREQPGDAGSQDSAWSDPDLKVRISGRAFLQNGQALGAATVIVLGQGSTTTDPDGNFDFPEVSTPYDIAVLTAEADEPTVTLYKGVTRTNPRLVALEQGSLSSTAYLDVTLIGDRLSAPDSTQEVLRTYVYASADRLAVSDRTTGESSGPSTSAEYSWPTDDPAVGTFHVLEFLTQVKTRKPTLFSYGRKDDVMVERGNRQQFQVLMRSSQQDELSISFVTPNGFSLRTAEVMLEVGDGQALGFYSRSSWDEPFVRNQIETLVPRISGTSLSVSASAHNSRGDFVSTHVPITGDLASIEVQLPSSAPSQGRPLDGAIGVDLKTDAFSWAPLRPISVSVLTIGFENPDLTVKVVTSEAQAMLPSVEELGIGSIPPGVSAGWSVTGYGDVSSVDDTLDPDRRVTEQFGPYSAMTSGWTQPRTFKPR